MGRSPKRKVQAKMNPAQASYAAELPFPCWPQGCFASVHI